MPTFTLQTDPQNVLQALRPLLIPIYEILEVAIPRAHDVIAENGWEVTGHLLSHVARAEAKKLLSGRNCPVEFDDLPRSLEMDRIPMEGLATTFDGIAVKILKGSDVPRAATGPRQDFYQQFITGLIEENHTPVIRSLLVLWDCSRSGSNLQLRLCCTKDKKAEDYWMMRIPHPAEWMVTARESAALEDDFHDLLVGDQSQQRKG